MPVKIGEKPEIFVQSKTKRTKTLSIAMEAEQTTLKFDQHVKFLILKRENMRLSKKGLLFSGPTAFISNLSYYPIRYEERDYNSNEQGYQWTKATRHEQHDTAAEIKRCTKAFDILYAGADIETTIEWKKNAPLLLATLFHLKMMIHPELLQRLIATSPHKLIEASTSKKWGGGVPQSHRKYTTQTSPYQAQTYSGTSLLTTETKKLLNCSHLNRL